MNNPPRRRAELTGRFVQFFSRDTHIATGLFGVFDNGFREMASGVSNVPVLVALVPLGVLVVWLIVRNRPRP